MIPLQVKAFVFDSPPRNNHSGPGLKTAAKRYTTSYSAQNAEGLTVLFTHCIGSRMILIYFADGVDK